MNRILFIVKFVYSIEMNDFERKQYFGCKRSFLGFYTTGFHLRDNV